MTFTEAEYHTPYLPEHAGNPCIEALPPEIPPEDYPKSLLVLPPYSEEDRKLPSYRRLECLQRIGEIHVPTKEDSFIMLSLRRCLNWCYVARNPMSIDVVKNALKKNGFDSSENMLRYLNRLHAPIYGFSILGISGLGKTTSIDNILNLYPQVIVHHEYYGIPFEAKQLVWLKIDCPHDGKVKGFCNGIMNSIDVVLNEHYCDKFLRNTTGTNFLIIKIHQILRSLNLGVLITDEIQNIDNANMVESRMSMSFIIGLTNTLKIPVVMIGSPKFLNVLQREFQMAKRGSGEGEIKMTLMEKDSREWEFFLKTLWRYQFTQKIINLTKEMSDVFFDESVGNPFLAAILYKIVQDDAILNKSECFNVDNIRDVSKRMLGLTKKKRMDMLNGIDIELNKYKYLLSASTRTSTSTVVPVPSVCKEDKKEDLQTIFEQNLMQKFDLAIKDAQNIVKRTMAAYPNDTDIP